MTAHAGSYVFRVTLDVGNNVLLRPCTVLRDKTRFSKKIGVNGKVVAVRGTTALSCPGCLMAYAMLLEHSKLSGSCKSCTTTTRVKNV